MQYCSNSSALAMELLQSCAKPSMLQFLFKNIYLEISSGKCCPIFFWSQCVKSQFLSLLMQLLSHYYYAVLVFQLWWMYQSTQRSLGIGVGLICLTQNDLLYTMRFEPPAYLAPIYWHVYVRILLRLEYIRKLLRLVYITAKYRIRDKPLSKSVTKHF